MPRPLVFVESPYAGDVAANRLYLQKCILDSINRGENPYASHGFFTQYLDDTVLAERRWGIDLGNQWRMVCDLTVFYYDLGWSAGMIEGLEFCNKHNCRYEMRMIL
jgi:hypothetical protein